MALIMGGGPQRSTLPPLPCSAEPTPPVGMAASIISRVTKPVACVQPAGGLLRAYCMDQRLSDSRSAPQQSKG